ncbi:MAG: hypothetical protein QM479_05245 [Pseudomonadota bacterium]
MKTNIRNIKKSVSNIITAAVTTVSVVTELAADTTSLAAKAIAATPKIGKATLLLPFSASEGYLMEADNMSAEEAEEAAFKYVKQEVATTIDQAGESAGKLVAMMFEDDEDENPITTSEKQKGVINE